MLSLIETLNRGARKSHRIRAAKALGRLRPQLAYSTAALIKASLTADATVSAAATSALQTAKSRHKEITLALITLIKDEDRNLRWKAGQVLEQMASKAVSAAPQLINLLDDEDRGVRALALSALTKIPLDKKILRARLLRAIDDESSVVREYAIRGLADAGPRRALVKRLVKTLNDPARRVQDAGLSALVSLGGRQAVSAILPLLRNRNSPRRRVQAVEHVLMSPHPIHDPRLRDAANRALTELVQYKDDKVRVRAEHIRMASWESNNVAKTDVVQRLVTAILE